MPRSALFAFVVAAVGWGTGGIATRAALIEGVGVWTMVTLRIAIAAVLLVGLILLRNGRQLDRLNLTVGAVMALLNLLGPYVLFTFAVVLLVSGDTGLGGAGRPLVAAGLSLIAVGMIGYAGAYARRHAGEYDSTVVTGVQFVIAAALLLPVMLLIEGVPTDISERGWSLIVYMGIFSSFLPFFIFYRLLRTIAVTTVSLIGYMVPLIALAGGIILLDEQLEPGIAVGGMLIFAGMILTDRASRAANLSVP